MAQNLDFDDVDKIIVKNVARDARKSSREIAKETRVSHQTVLSRIRKLEQNGVIKGYTALLDWEKLGAPVKMLYLIEAGGLNNKQIDHVKAFLDKEKWFTHYALVSGEYDFVVFAKFKDQKEAGEKTSVFRAFLAKQFPLNSFRSHSLWSFTAKQNIDF